MTKSYTINIDGIGPILFRKSRRAKRVIISIRTSKGARVAVPARVSFQKALEFVYLKKEWVQRNLAKIKQNENQQKVSMDAFLTIDKVDVKKRLADKLYYLARKYGFTYNKASSREQKTRWGSCSSRNNISLNIRLILLPEELIDYVILHELVHTRIHNHSKKFWAELEEYVENAKVISKKLRTSGLELG